MDGSDSTHKYISILSRTALARTLILHRTDSSFSIILTRIIMHTVLEGSFLHY